MHDSAYHSSRGASLRLEKALLLCEGPWTVRHLGSIESALRHMDWPAGPIQIDLSGVERMDTGGAWVVLRLQRRLERNGHPAHLLGLSTTATEMLDLVRDSRIQESSVPRPTSPNLVEELGQNTVERIGAGIGLVSFIGETGVAWGRQLLNPRRIRWAEFADNLGDAGHRALGIVGLLSFLLGIVIAYQGGVQLRQYGASLFVADLVGLSMVRELAPMITAIIVAGRTGSAYTAQIGTMQVTEEIDALRSMGISPMDMLVLPKLLALTLALPLLTVFADLMGIAGGMLMSALQLEIAFSTFIQRIGAAVSVQSFLVGIGKAPVFAAIIATIGCYQGFQVVGSAESVGRRTTVSVVHSILAVIVIDAAFSVAFSQMGI